MSRPTDIAVIGIGCRFPDGPDVATFWDNLMAGVVSTRQQSEERLRAAGLSTAQLTHPAFVPVAATVPDVEMFAAEFFGYSPAEAESIDPSQRIFLEVCWEALESSGHAPTGSGGPVVGVFASGGPSPYTVALQAAKLREGGLASVVDDLDLTLGGTADFMASRVAYKLGLRGPSVGVQTACSSSLTGVHYAVLSLLSGECDLAVAGGAAVSDPLVGYTYTPGGVMSEDGYCRSFEARSTGTAAGAGAGAVVLRRLTDALADGDPVLAVVRGSAVGNDGALRTGFTAPSAKGLAGVVAGALTVAEAPPHTVRYVEAHGSGTQLGDSLELRGLTAGFRIAGDELGTPRRGSGDCALASVKANIGHAGWAAGIAGFIKAVHVAHTGTVPPHPSFEHPRDPGVLADSPFFVPTEPVKMTETDDWHVVVNSMGLGGTNATVVLAPPPAPTRPSAEPVDVVRLVLSARNRTELDALSRAVAERLDAGAPVGDVAHTLRVGRRAFPERRVVTAAPNQMAAALRMPRPPHVRTARIEPRRVLLVAPEPGGSIPAELLDHLVRAFRGRAEVVASAPGQPPTDAYLLRLTRGTAGAGLVPHFEGRVPSVQQAWDEAFTTAWLNGADVDWEYLARDGRGRRLALPTYPYQRRRYWALDHVSLPETASVDGPLRKTSATSRPEAGADPVEETLLNIWAELFGRPDVGLDDEFGTMGGTSLLSVRMGLEVHARLGVLVNLHRAGGSRATVRRLAEIVRAANAAEPTAGSDDETADGQGAIVDADLTLPLGETSAHSTTGSGVLLTGATGFLGSFLLHQLLTRTDRRVYCLVRADSEEDALRRLSDAAAFYALPAPDLGRVRVVVGDLRDVANVCSGYRDGELATQVGHLLHCAARVVFTEPYSELRDDNVLPTVGLVRWARANGIREFGFVSSLAATGPALGTNGRTLESREQPLDPAQGGYGVGKWVCERLLARAESEGMRVRIFRPGLILGSTTTGACNPKDMMWRMLAAGTAVGAHPLDDRPMPMAPVDLVSQAVVDLLFAPGAAGRAFHLVAREGVGAQRLFALLAAAGLPTEPLSREDWLSAVAARARTGDNHVLTSMALYDLAGHEGDATSVEAEAWGAWLAEAGHDAAPTGESLRAALCHLAGKDPAYLELLGADATSGTDRDD
ncbi:thioester reductase domain-containing protein [Streptomyces sp. PTM05]|uniref:Thioester reductase domain-containing protein n=1 Tax=Streptantibioticus parmotrematis TaxID=2873249 RepID=A0ABS7QNH2_9ACTN|nr:thioester reductase domain-containing protein [Streptantibioticus parmotrematis]MBY8884724.1 thioester reductase domain-containing protein [Streptantibioticus parmotrematis]